MVDDDAAKIKAQSDSSPAEPVPDQEGQESQPPAAACETDDHGGTLSAEEEQVEEEFADAQPPSTKLENDFVPLGGGEEETESIKLAQAERAGSALIPCPGCNTELEPWQLACHHCGCIVSQHPVPSVVATDKLEETVKQSLSDWLKGGLAAFEAGRYSLSENCFREALMRVKGVENARDREVEVRKHLAQALEKQEKRTEASAQYLALSKLTRRSKEQFEKRARELSGSTTDVLASLDGGIIYRQPEGKETRLVPLYCANCKQMLVEAELHGYRNGRVQTVRCFCGYDGKPLVRVDAKHLKGLRNASDLRLERALLLQSAAQLLPEERERGVAAACAILLGFCGAHRFYLGETFYGLVYFFWWLTSWLVYVFNAGRPLNSVMLIWSCIPWLIALFEAVNYMQMSRVTFNLTYNIENILSRLPLEETTLNTHAEIFSMEAGEGPDLDDFEELAPAAAAHEEG